MIANGRVTKTETALPVREKNSDAEVELCSRWMDDHGDPGEWTQKTRLDYAKAVATARAEGRL